LGTNGKTALGNNISATAVAVTDLVSSDISTVKFDTVAAPGSGFKAHIILVNTLLQPQIVAAANALASVVQPYVDPVPPPAGSTTGVQYSSKISATYGATPLSVNVIATYAPTSASPTDVPTSFPTVTRTGTPLGSSGSGGGSGLSSGATAGVIILIIIAVILLGLAYKKYKEPAPWEQGGNFAKLLSEEDEMKMGKSVQLRIETDMTESKPIRRVSLNNTPLDGGYLESVAFSHASVQPKQALSTTTAIATGSRGVNVHPTLRKNENPIQALPSDDADLLGEMDGLEAVYPVAGGHTDDLVVQVEASSDKVASAVTASTSWSIDGTNTQETRIDAMDIQNTNDSSNLDGIEMPKHGGSTDTFTEKTDTLGRHNLNRQSQC